MNEPLSLLSLSAAIIGLTHTILGPDHYIPFIMIGRARNWPLRRTMAVTAACGAAHVLSSVILGTLGIALGLAVRRLELLESARGELATWMMIVFGLVYAIWGLKKAFRGTLDPEYQSRDGAENPAEPDRHRHTHRGGMRSTTAWGLFLIFGFGPCEPLIPLLMYPAATHSIAGLCWVTGVFGAVTIGTMLFIVSLMHRGASRLNFGRIEPFTHSIAGASIACAGVAIRLFGI